MNNFNLKSSYLSDVRGLNLNGGKSLLQTAETVKRWAASSGQFRKTAAAGVVPVKNFFANQILALLPNSVFMKLAPFFERVSFSCEEDIYRCGDAINAVYFPESAVMSEYQILEDGRTIEVAMTGKEGVVGFSTLLNSYPAANWTQISAAGSALKISTHVLKKELSHLEPFQSLLFDYINKYINQVSRRAICNGYHMTEARFCSWLLMLLDRSNHDKLRLTQEQIARYLGVHRPSVTQIALTLRKKKIINYVRGEITVLDRRALENSSCGCYELIDGTFLTQSLF